MSAQISDLAARTYACERSESQAAQQPDEVSLTALAREVIAGKWGNGADRKRRLTAAGHDYKAVQAEVNRLLRG